MFPIQSVSSGEYATTGALTAGLATKAAVSHVHAEYATTTDLANVASPLVWISDYFTVNQLNRVYVIRSSSTDTVNAQTVNIDIPYDALGNGFILLYNASQYQKLVPGTSDGDSVFQQAGVADTYGPTTNAYLPVGLWMAIWRTDQVSSGTTVSGGLTPSASYKITLF